MRQIPTCLDGGHYELVVYDMKYCSSWDNDDYLLVLHQPQVSSCVKTAANDIQFPVEVTDDCMKRLVILETFDLTR